MSRNIITILFIIALFSGLSFSNVIVSGLSVEPDIINPTEGQTVNISYHLNESADNGVDVKIYNSGDQLVRTLTGTTTRGLNSVSWDGKDEGGASVSTDDYYIVVEASDDGHEEWTQVSLEEPGNVMLSGKGITVNTNPQSPYYGIVYVSNTSEGTSTNTGGYMQFDGVYGFWPESASFATFIDTVNFNNGSSNSPYRVSVGDNDKIYIGDYNDNWENVWQIDGDLDKGTLVRILTSADRTNHGNVLTAIMKGIDGDQILYTTDEDRDDFDVWKFGVGNGPFPWKTSGDMIVSESDSMADVWDFDVDPDGNFLYACDDQDAPSFLNPDVPPSFAKYDLSTNPATVIWSSPTTEAVHNIMGIGMYQPKGWVAGCASSTVADEESNLFIYDINTGALLDSLINPGGGTNRDVAFDAVGNLYVVNTSIEWWRAFSPPDGANSTSTKSTFTVQVVTALDDLPANTLPKEFALHKAYPNPFNPTTTITYDLPKNGNIKLKIFDPTGQEVKTLINGYESAGSHAISWDGTNANGTIVASGVYIYRLEANGLLLSNKVIFIK